MLLLVSDENFNNDIAGLSMPAVIEVADDLPLGQVIADILLIAETSEEQEWEGRVIYLPM